MAQNVIGNAIINTLTTAYNRWLELAQIGEDLKGLVGYVKEFVNYTGGLKGPDLSFPTAPIEYYKRKTYGEPT